MPSARSIRRPPGRRRGRRRRWGGLDRLRSAIAPSAWARLWIVAVTRALTAAPPVPAGMCDWLVWPATEAHVRTKLRAAVLRRACRWLAAPLPPDEETRLNALHAWTFSTPTPRTASTVSPSKPANGSVCRSLSSRSSTATGNGSSPGGASTWHSHRGTNRSARTPSSDPTSCKCPTSSMIHALPTAQRFSAPFVFGLRGRAARPRRRQPCGDAVHRRPSTSPPRRRPTRRAAPPGRPGRHRADALRARDRMISG